jgi:hypothetical protein
VEPWSRPHLEAALGVVLRAGIEDEAGVQQAEAVVDAGVRRWWPSLAPWEAAEAMSWLRDYGATWGCGS